MVPIWAGAQAFLVTNKHPCVFCCRQAPVAHGQPEYGRLRSEGEESYLIPEVVGFLGTVRERWQVLFPDPTSAVARPLLVQLPEDTRVNLRTGTSERSRSAGALVAEWGSSSRCWKQQSTMPWMDLRTLTTRISSMSRYMDGAISPGLQELQTLRLFTEKWTLLMGRETSWALENREVTSFAAFLLVVFIF